MTGYAESYLGRLRHKIGHDLVILPGVQVAVLDAHGRLLVQRRTDTGEWELPSGACEPGSSFVETAAIELQEEAGLALSPERFVAFGTTSRPDVQTLSYPNGDVVQAYAVCFLVRLAAGEDTRAHGCDGEATDHRWVDPDRLPTPMIGSSQRVVSLLLAYRDTGEFQAS